MSIGEHISKIKAGLEKVKGKKTLSTTEVVSAGLIVNSYLQPSMFTLYRLLGRGQIKAINVSSGGRPVYLIDVASLKNFLTKRYNL